MEKSVFIDAGHGGVDAGCPMGAGEKYYNLGVALRLRKVLEERGYKVGMSRLGDKSVSLKERCQKANAFYQQKGLLPVRAAAERMPLRTRRHAA